MIYVKPIGNTFGWPRMGICVDEISPYRNAVWSVSDINMYNHKMLKLYGKMDFFPVGIKNSPIFEKMCGEFEC